MFCLRTERENTASLLKGVFHVLRKYLKSNSGILFILHSNRAYPFIFCCGYLLNASDKIWPTSFNFIYIYIFMAKLDVTDSIRHFPNIISREFFN